MEGTVVRPRGSPPHDILPGRRRNVGGTSMLRSSQWWMLCLVVVLAVCGTSEALVVDRSALQKLETSQEGKIDARQDPLGSSSQSSQSSIPTSSSISPSATHKASSTSQGGSSPTLASSSPALTALPKVFDSGLGSNFSSASCPTFLEGLNNNQSFTNCLPLSLLLQGSLSFFRDSGDEVTLTAVLDATCNVVFPTCNSLMSELGERLISSSVCGPDYNLGNPIVTEAYNGFLSYAPLYQAGCLKGSSSGSGASDSSASDSSSNQYCFVGSTVNATSLDNSYVYSLPLGIPLTGGIRPTCSACLQQTMGIFAQAAANASNPLSVDYSPAATEINSGCGPSFVQSTVKPTSTTGAASVSRAQGGSALAAAFALALFLA